MKTNKNRNYSFLILLLTVLLTLLSAASFAFALNSAPEDSSFTAETVISNTHSELWPWNILDESVSSPALEFINDTEIINEEGLNSFAKSLLMSSSHNTTPYSAIESTDFSDEIMMTESDFYIWMKDRSVKASNGEEFITGFFGFSGEYDIAFSSYCIRSAALSEDDVWIEYTRDELVDLFTRSERAVVYHDGEFPTEAEEYLRVNGEIYVAESTLIDMTASYIYRVAVLSGFESTGDDLIALFADTINAGKIKAYRNGDLLMLYFYDTAPFKLYLFYDLGTQTYCGWIRN